MILVSRKKHFVQPIRFITSTKTQKLTWDVIYSFLSDSIQTQTADMFK